MASVAPHTPLELVPTRDVGVDLLGSEQDAALAEDQRRRRRRLELDELRSCAEGVRKGCGQLGEAGELRGETVAGQ